MNRADAFLQSVKEHDKNKAQAQARKNGPRIKFDPIDYTALPLNSYKPVRFLGLPPNQRGTDAFSPKAVYISNIVNDKGNFFRCVWPDVYSLEGRTWLLWRIYNKVLSYTYDNTTNKRTYHNEQKAPAIFNRVFKNGRPEVSYEKGWKPTLYVAMNVIDREQMDWHRENKKTFILSKKGSQKSDGSSVYYEPGVPSSLIETILDTIVRNKGDWENYDIAIRKVEGSPYYYANHGADSFNLEGRHPMFTQDYFNTASNPLTDEERSWKKYNLDVIYPVSSYSKILFNLGAFIKTVDVIFGTKFLPELQNLVTIEKKEKDASTGVETRTSLPKKETVLTDDSFKDTTAHSFQISEGSPTNFIHIDSSGKTGTSVDSTDTEELPVEFSDIPEEKEEEKKEEKKKEPPKRSVAKKKAIDWEKLIVTYPHISDMTEEEKDAVDYWDEKEKTFVYKAEHTKERGNLFRCVTDGCTMNTLQFFHACPMCGVDFEYSE